MLLHDFRKRLRKQNMTMSISLRIHITTAVAIVFLLETGLVSGRTAGTEETGLLQQRIDRLETVVQDAEGVRAIKRLHYSYAHYLESGMWNDLADLFTDSASGQFPTGTVNGKASLRKYFMDQAGRTSPGLAEGQLNVHLMLQPIVTLGADGKTAKAAWHEMAMVGRFGKSASWSGGIYENDYALENGVWKISRIYFYEQYQGEYELFGHKAPPKWNIAYHFDSAHVGVTIPQSAMQPSPSNSSSRVAAGQRLKQLAQRVQRLNDETDVRNLQHSYGYYLDRKMWDDVADLFAEGGSLELDQRGVYVSRAHIVRALEEFYGKPPLRTGELFDHLNLSTVVTIATDGLTASARTQQLSMLGVNGEFARWEVGTYENEFVKQGSIWKMKAVHYYPRMLTDFDKGWARDARPAATESKTFPPDRRPSHPLQSYPERGIVAFHYANPVTGRPIQYPDGPIAHVPVVSTSRSTASGAIDSSRMESTLAEVERQVEAAIAVDAVENLNSSYGYYLDESAWDQMADTFSVTSGAKEISGAGVYIGQDRIRKVLNLRGPRGGRGATSFTIHQLTQPVIHISEDGQTARARFRLFQGGGAASGSSGSWIGGIYENTAVKENGEWKFGIQDLHHIFNASYRNGWGKMPAQQGTVGSAAAAPRVLADMAPDRPIRSRQYAFPEIIEPAFHYRNPVSGRMPKELLP
jgi:hypothetical protein